MSTQGDKPYDYKNEINTALGQANQPKSDLAKTTNVGLQNNLGQIIESLMHAQNLGNSNAPNQAFQDIPGQAHDAIFQSDRNNLNNPSNPLQDLLPSLQSKSFSEASLSGVNGLSGAISSLLGGTQNNDVRNLVGSPINVNTSTLNSIAQILGTKQNNDVADLRARFGAAGGNSRGTPAAYAEAQLKAQQIPELQQALSSAAGQEFDRGLASKSLNLQALLGADSNVGQNLSTVLNSFSTTRGQDLSNVQGNQQNQLGLIDSVIKAAGGAGSQSLGAAQNNNQNQQFNVNQLNDMVKLIFGSNQAGNESQIGRQFSGIQDLFQAITGLAGAGTPGGGANVNVGNNGQYIPSQFTQILGSLAGLF